MTTKWPWNHLKWTYLTNIFRFNQVKSKNSKLFEKRSKMLMVSQFPIRPKFRSNVKKWQFSFNFDENSKILDFFNFLNYLWKYNFWKRRFSRNCTFWRNAHAIWTFCVGVIKCIFESAVTQNSIFASNG